MILIIGGAFQGKASYVKEKYGLKEADFYDAEIPLNPAGRIAINHLHEYIKKRMKEGGNPEEEILDFINKSDCILICDEIGNGIVPLDSFEREWREKTGRILIQVAAKAESVERVICGIAQKIK